MAKVRYGVGAVYGHTVNVTVCFLTFWSSVISFAKIADSQIIEPKMSASFVPDHKASMVLFLDRVYGIDNQDFLLHVLEVGFLPDMRAAASLDTVSLKKILKIKNFSWSSRMPSPSIFLCDFRWLSVRLKWPWHWTATSAQPYFLCSPSVLHSLLARTIGPSWSTPCSTQFIVCPAAEPSPRRRETSLRSVSCHSAS